MYAMGRIGSYISGGLYTVSGPFHVFGGAVDVVVVEQPDGSFKSSPWYVRFGKFQGVLKAKEKVVNISVNGVDMNLQMYLDERGQAYFLKEVEELEDSPLYPSSSSDEMDGQSKKSRRHMGSKSYNYYANKSNLGDQIDANNGKAVATNSCQSRILGLVSGWGSMKKKHYQEGGDDKAMVRISSWDRAEIAANLLEVQWSTNLATSKCRKDDAMLFSVSDTSDVKGVEDMLNNEETDQNQSSLPDIIEASLDHPTLSEPTGSGNLKVETTFQSGFEGLECSIAESSVCTQSLSTKKSVVEDSMIVTPDSQIPQLPEACLNEWSDEEKVSEQEVALASFNRCGEESGSDGAQAFMLSKTAETSTMGQKVEGAAMAENICTIESFSNSDHGSQSEKCESVGDFVQFYGNCGFKKALSTQERESPEDEHFLFSDLDEYKLRETWCESHLSVGEDNENHSLFCVQGSGDGSSLANKEACSSTDQSVQEDQLGNLGNLTGYFDALSKPIGIPKVCGVAHAEVERPAKSLPIMWSCMEGLDRVKLRYPLCHSLDSHSKSQEWTSDRRGKQCNITLGVDNENQSSQEHSDEQDTHVLKGLQNGAGTPGEPSKAVVDSDGNWRLRPFFLKKSRSRKTMLPLLHDSEISNSEVALDININEESDINVPKSKGRRKMVKSNTPTSEQLALLNLKEGSNTITFTFSTAMLGKQKVDARIYLWKWNIQIVISDVDGTITKSDVLGQFMPLVGADWSQTGVAHLFSAIKDNGYKLLFLSARAISQAYLTRQFLLNLKQDGKALPDGPVVISPDGLFPSLFREVIRRTPHEFKIACLEDIRALFPHEYNPFYAGFGNRDTDEISYLKVGIPRGKIFIINPKGEVAVNQCVDTKSYIALRTLVEDMFPPAASSQQEDFNTWNYWKLPPPVIDN